MYRKVINVGPPTEEQAACVVVTAGLFVVIDLGRSASMQVMLHIVLEKQTRPMLQGVVDAHLIVKEVFHHWQRGPHPNTLVINAAVVILLRRVAARPRMHSFCIEPLKHDHNKQSKNIRCIKTGQLEMNIYLHRRRCASCRHAVPFSAEQS